MNKIEATAIVNKCMKVIISCKTYEQLDSAIKYSDLAYNALAKTLGLINETTFSTLRRRSLDVAYRNISKELAK